MKNFDSKDFVESVDFEEYDVYFHGIHYIITSYCDYQVDSNNKIIPTPLNLLVYPVSEGYIENDKYILVKQYSNTSPIFSCSEMDMSVAVDKFLNAKIWEGKTFWEVENEMSILPI